MKNINTPCYVYDIEQLEQQVMCVKSALKDEVGLCYALKANSFILKDIDNYIDRLEVCSPGEYEICKKHKINPSKIIVSGVNKTYESLNGILEYSKGEGIYTIESMNHFNILDRCAKENNITLNILIRLTSGNQFGLCKSDFEEVLRLVLDNDNMSFAGIHYYSGTQKKMSKIEKELSMLNEYAHYIKETYDVEYIELEYGPSMLVSYFEEENIDSKEMQLSKLNAILQEVNNYDKITLEYGRFLAANCGYYITKINDIKKTEKTNYIIVDGGIHHVNYYGQMMGMKKPYMKVVLNSVKNERKNISVKDDEGNEIKEKWTICGSLCTVNDIIVREKNIDNPKINDIIVFENTGAYSAMEGMNLFLSRSLPSVYLYKKDKTLCKVRDAIETYTFNDVL